MRITEHDRLLHTAFIAACILLTVFRVCPSEMFNFTGCLKEPREQDLVRVHDTVVQCDVRIGP